MTPWLLPKSCAVRYKHDFVLNAFIDAFYDDAMRRKDSYDFFFEHPLTVTEINWDHRNQPGQADFVTFVKSFQIIGHLLKS